MSPDGSRLVAGCDDGFRVLDPLKPSTVVHSELRKRPASSPALSPDGAWVATGTSDKRLQIWNARDGHLVTNLAARGNSAVTFSPDNRWLVSASLSEYWFWEVGSWKPGVRVIQSSAVKARSCVAFAPDRNIVALSISREAVRLFRAGTDYELATLPTGRLLSHLSFSPDGTKLLMTYEPGFAQVWDLRLVRAELAQMNLDWEETPADDGNLRQDKAPVLSTSASN